MFWMDYEGAMNMKKRKKKKGRLITIILVSVLFIGVFLLVYPTFSNYWNNIRQAHDISKYIKDVENLSEDKYQEILDAARKYNESLPKDMNGCVLTDEQLKVYESLLDISGTGIMGYIEIPSMHCSMPIYHGADENVLQVAIGHLEWSSLPVGGTSSHCVLSGHRGLPSAKLFTDLDQLVEGDRFKLIVLNEVMTYEVDQISTVEPQEVNSLQIVDGMDYCTLVTCTPYGINTHRLLVRGHRVENDNEIYVSADAMQIESMIVASAIAVPCLIIMMLSVFIPKRKHRNKKVKNN